MSGRGSVEKAEQPEASVEQQSAAAPAERQPGDGLTAGRVVHYVLGADGPGIGRRGECRPAMVVKVWGRPPARPYPIQLQVFLDGTNDDPHGGLGLSWRTSVPYAPEDSSGNTPGTWHWGSHEGPPRAAETFAGTRPERA